MPTTKSKGKSKAIAVDDETKGEPSPKTRRGRAVAEKDKVTKASSNATGDKESPNRAGKDNSITVKGVKPKNGAFKNGGNQNQGDVIEPQSDDDGDQLEDGTKDVNAKKSVLKNNTKTAKPKEHNDVKMDDKVLQDIKPKRRVAKKALSQSKDEPETIKPKRQGAKKAIVDKHIVMMDSNDDDDEDYAITSTSKKGKNEIDSQDELEVVKSKKVGAKKARIQDEEAAKPKGRAAKKATAIVDKDNDIEDDELLAVPSTSQQMIKDEEQPREIKPKKRGAKKTGDDKPESKKISLQDTEEFSKRVTRKDSKDDEDSFDTKPKKTATKKVADSKDDKFKATTAKITRVTKKATQDKPDDNIVSGDKKKITVKKSANAPQNKEEEKMKIIKWQGKVPVDEECKEKINSSHVYYEDDVIYYAMLNQTNVQNNNNKFFLMEILEDNDKHNYSVWFRWGRVGFRGQSSLKNYGADLNQAKAAFEEKFKDKTKNEWSERLFFQKIPGKYELLAMDFNTGNDAPIKESEKLKPPKELPKSKLHLRLQSFIELIFSIKAMEATVLEMKYNAKKAPLGKLTVEQVTAGYAALKEIEYCITNNKIGKELIEACNSFYTKIPHDFGMRRPPLIQTNEELKVKIELLKTLGDIQVAMSILNETVDVLNNPIDSHYNSLHCNLKPIEKETPIFQMVNEYLQNTHAATHQLYKLELLDLFDCDRENEEEKYKDVGNRMLLWHGSRLTNAPGILKQGLRIAPPEAPCTGYMFGKGVYFADMCSKSANYCYTTRNQNEGAMYLCEVAVGTSKKLLKADYNAGNLPSGFHSVLGQGTVMPDPKMIKTLPNGTIVPLGKSVSSNVNGSLNYNEYIVYDVDQIKLKYVLRVKFLYK